MGKKISRAARKRMADAGRKSLQDWHARTREADGNAVADIDKFRDDIFSELGPNASTTRRALAQNAVMTYACTVWVNKQLRKTRNPERMAVIERASWISGNLTRLLKALGLDAKPRPRCLADIVAREQAENLRVSTPKLTVSDPKLTLSEVSPNVR